MSIEGYSGTMWKSISLKLIPIRLLFREM